MAPKVGWLRVWPTLEACEPPGQMQTQHVLFFIIRDLAIKVEIIWDMKGFSSFFCFFKAKFYIIYCERYIKLYEMMRDMQSTTTYFSYSEHHALFKIEVFGRPHW